MDNEKFSNLLNYVFILWDNEIIEDEEYHKICEKIINKNKEETK